MPWTMSSSRSSDPVRWSKVDPAAYNNARSARLISSPTTATVSPRNNSPGTTPAANCKADGGHEGHDKFYNDNKSNVSASDKQASNEDGGQPGAGLSRAALHRHHKGQDNLEDSEDCASERRRSRRAAHHAIITSSSTADPTARESQEHQHVRNSNDDNDHFDVSAQNSAQPASAYPPPAGPTERRPPPARRDTTDSGEFSTAGAPAVTSSDERGVWNGGVGVGDGLSYRRVGREQMRCYEQQQREIHEQQMQAHLQLRLQQVDMHLTLSAFPDLAFVAKGAMCKVFKAKDSHLSPAPVVLKMAIENGPREAERDLKTELSVLQNLSHPNLARLLGAGRTPKGRTFIVMEYLEGGTLRSRLDAAGGGLGFWPACKHALELASAMRYMHEEAIPGRCVLHRDLKPDNLGFSRNEMKLFDLGLAKVVQKSSNRINEAYRMTGEVGSLRYMAPEVARHRRYNEKADVHSFAIILWEMVTGWLPFAGLSPGQYMLRVVQHGQRPMVQFRWISSFKSLLASCWAESPQERPSFGEIHDALDALLVDREKTSSSRPRGRSSEESTKSPVVGSTGGSSKPKRGVFSRLLGGRSIGGRSFSLR